MHESHKNPGINAVRTCRLRDNVPKQMRGREKNRPAPIIFYVSGSDRDRSGQSEIQLRPELEDSRIEGRSYLAEVAGAKTVADLVKLRVVPGIEAFRAEFEPAAASFVEHEALEQREVPV